MAKFEWDKDVVLESERMTFRLITKDDAEIIYGNIIKTLDSLKQWMPWAKDDIKIENTNEFIAMSLENVAKNMGEFPFLGIDKATGKHAVSTGLMLRDGNVPAFEIGYWCVKEFQRKGYVSEAVKTLEDYAFNVLGAKRMQIRHEEGNAASKGVILKAGYEYEGTMRNFQLDGKTCSKPVSHLFYSKIK